MTGYKLSANDEWTDSWNETILAQLTGFETLEDYYLAFEVSTNNLVDALAGSYEQF
jgi:hypothetical protein